MGPEDEAGLLAEINVTPLVDVMLVLLVVFMVTAPMLVAGIPVALPQGGDERPDLAAETIQLSIDRNGIVYLDDRPVHPRLLAERLSALRETRSPAVQVRADESVRYGRVVEVLDAVRRAGIVDVGLVTRPSEPITGAAP